MDSLDKLKLLKTKLHKELPVSIAGINIVLAPLSSEDEVECHVFASQYEKIGYIAAIKEETLARTIVEVDGVRIPNFLETGETDTQTGEPILQPRFMAVRPIVQSLPSNAVDVLYSMYLVLLNDMDNDIKKTLKCKGAPVDLDNIIAQIENEELEPKSPTSRSPEEALEEAHQASKTIRDVANDAHPVAEAAKKHQAAQEMLNTLKGKNR